MGSPGHSRDGIRQTWEWIWAGAVREVHSWVPTNRWNSELAGPDAPESVEAFAVAARHPKIQPHGCLYFCRCPGTHAAAEIIRGTYRKGLGGRDNRAKAHIALVAGASSRVYCNS